MLPSVGIEAPGHIIFTIDTSGSMSDEQLGEIFSEIRLYRETFPCKLTVIQADSVIQSIVHYEQMDGEEIPIMNKVSGRGGTDFRPVFSWISDNAPGAFLLYATDGFGSYPTENTAAGVIWLLFKPHINEEQIPFGAVVIVNY